MRSAPPPYPAAMPRKTPQATPAHRGRLRIDVDGRAIEIIARGRANRLNAGAERVENSLDA